MRVDSAARAGLEASGWVVIARSWGAGMTVEEAGSDRLEALVGRVGSFATVSALRSADVAAILDLDQETVDDYPGDVATSHDRLTSARATPSVEHPGWGAFLPDGQLVAMTFVDVGEQVVETDFTVVRREWRGRGLGAAVKAASVISLVKAGHTRFRTGGSMDNTASIAANRAVGYVLDEEWLTYMVTSVEACGPILRVWVPSQAGRRRAGGPDRHA